MTRRFTIGFAAIRSDGGSAKHEEPFERIRKAVGEKRLREIKK